MAAVSEKDGCISLLELSPVRNPEDVMTLRREKERFMNHQKQQVSSFPPLWFYSFNVGE